MIHPSMILAYFMTSFEAMYSITLCYVMQYVSTFHSQTFILYYTALYSALLHYPIICCTTLYYTTLHYTTLYYAILYHTILYYTILYYTILYYVILYYIILQYIILQFQQVIPEGNPRSPMPFGYGHMGSRLMGPLHKEFLVLPVDLLLLAHIGPQCLRHEVARVGFSKFGLA